MQAFFFWEWKWQGHFFSATVDEMFFSMVVCWSSEVQNAPFCCSIDSLKETASPTPQCRVWQSSHPTVIMTCLEWTHLILEFDTFSHFPVSYIAPPPFFCESQAFPRRSCLRLTLGPANCSPSGHLLEMHPKPCFVGGIPTKSYENLVDCCLFTVHSTVTCFASEVWPPPWPHPVPCSAAQWEPPDCRIPPPLSLSKQCLCRDHHHRHHALLLLLIKAPNSPPDKRK